MHVTRHNLLSSMNYPIYACSQCGEHYYYLLRDSLCILCAIKTKEAANQIFITPIIIFPCLGGSFSIDIKSLSAEYGQILLKIRNFNTLSVEYEYNKFKINNDDVEIKSGEANIFHLLKDGKNSILFEPHHSPTMYIVYSIIPKKPFAMELQPVSEKETLNSIHNIILENKLNCLTFNLKDEKSDDYFNFPCRGDMCKHIDVFEYNYKTNICPICSAPLKIKNRDMLIEGIIKFIRSMPKLKGTSDAIFYDDGTFMLGQYKCRIQNGKIKEVECANIIGQQVCELPQPDLSSMLHPSLLPKDAQDLQQNKCWYMPESYNKLIAECQENHENDAKTEQYVKSKKSIDQMNSECNRRIKEKEACSMDFSDSCNYLSFEEYESGNYIAKSNSINYQKLNQILSKNFFSATQTDVKSDIYLMIPKVQPLQEPPKEVKCDPKMKVFAVS